MIRETSDITFENDVLKADGPVLVDFWAPWCATCRVACTILDNIARVAGEKAAVFKLNVDENTLMKSRYGITELPTVVVFRNGRIEREFEGVQTEQIYLRALAIT